MSVWLIVLIVVGASVLVGGGLFLRRKDPSTVLRDQLRETDPRAAETLDEIAMTAMNPVALPMHDRSFDPPR
jgi:hypothetical protein